MRFWSVLLALCLVLCTAVFLYAPLDVDWWLPNYLATNKKPLDALQRSAASFQTQVAALNSVTTEAQGAATVQDKNEERLRSLSRRAGETKSRLEADRKLVLDMVAQNFLTGPTRLAAASSGEAILALTRAEDLLSNAALAEAIPELELARDRLTSASRELDQALAEIDVPVSRIARDVDWLFIVILAITGVVFLGTELALVYVTWKYGARPGHRAVYSHGNNRLELIWTIIPAGILAFIAVYQLGTWADIKFQSRQPQVPPLAEVSARQFQWIIRYPGPDARIGSEDDLVLINDLHFVKGQSTLIQLKSQDVIHSFFLPQMRIKQDAVPGLTIPVWFDADKAGRYELVCAELCGWGHYKMRSVVTVHDTQQDFDEWMRTALRLQNQDRAPRQVAETRDAQGS